MRTDRCIPIALTLGVFAACSSADNQITKLASEDSSKSFHTVDNTQARARMIEMSKVARKLGRADTFVSASGFSEQDFKLIQKGLLSVTLTFGDQPGEIEGGYDCTAWLVDYSDPGHLIVALARHCLASQLPLSKFEYSRLNMDGTKFVAEGSDIQVVADPNLDNDQALIRIPKPAGMPDFNLLPWVDSADLKTWEPLLQEGFPNKLTFDSVLFAQIETVIRPVREGQKNAFWVHSPNLGSDSGSSGAPVVFKDSKGNLKVVAIQTDSIQIVNKETGLVEQNIIIRTLNFSALLPQFDKK